MGVQRSSSYHLHLIVLMNLSAAIKSPVEYCFDQYLVHIFHNEVYIMVKIRISEITDNGALTHKQGVERICKHKAHVRLHCSHVLLLSQDEFTDKQQEL